MGLESSPVIFLLCLMLVLQSLQTTEGHRKMLEENMPEVKHHGENWNNHLQLPVNQGVDSDKNLQDHSTAPHMDPQLNVFFHYNGLKAGKKIPIYFPKIDPSTSPHLLSRQESDSIPFSSSQLPHILKFFSFPEDSKQAKAMEHTLYHCEYPAMKGESKFCATSLESLLDSVHEIFGPNSKFRVLTTNYLSESLTPLQNYTVSEAPKDIIVPKLVGCHTLPYPYKVFYCHGQAKDTKLYQVMLDGEDGGRVEAVAICHMDTSQWDPDHVAFRVLKTVPGASPVCHFFPADNLIWMPTS